MAFKFRKGQRIMLGATRTPALFQSYKGNGICRVLVGGELQLVKRRIIKPFALDLNAVKAKNNALGKRLKDMRFARLPRSNTWRLGNATRYISVRLEFDGRHTATHAVDGKEISDPSRFDDEEGMLKAITFEATRRRDGIEHKVHRHF